MLSPDYAKFELQGGKVIPSERITQKLKAIPFPNFQGKTVLDVGCDYGQFSFYAASEGACVVGLDRNRDVKGRGQTNLVAICNENARVHSLNCNFHAINIGKQWKEFGKFDHVLVMSVYHHLFNNCGDHKAVWFWLWRHCGESLIFEGPLDNQDRVVQMNVQHDFSKSDILSAASIYFDPEYIGPALHEPFRYVYRMIPKKNLMNEYAIAVEAGAGGATKAFLYSDERRIKEIETIVGYKPAPGSLNCVLDREFNWGYHYYPGYVLDVKERGKGLDSEWDLREARFYPVEIIGQKGTARGHIFRFRGESYPSNFIEIISDVYLRDIEPTEIRTCS